MQGREDEKNGDSERGMRQPQMLFRHRQETATFFFSLNKHVSLFSLWGTEKIARKAFPEKDYG